MKGNQDPTLPLYDIIVVGGGGSGAPLAARLSEDPQRSVLLLEAGPASCDFDSFPPELLNAGTVQGAMPGHPNNWSFMGNLSPDRPYSIARGRILGGSTSISGTYFIRARKEDLERWSLGGNHEWSWHKTLPYYKKIENDLDLGDNDQHGQNGPMTVTRPPQNHPVTVAFTRAAAEAGYPAEPDKNNQDQPGYGPVPTNSQNGVRINTSVAYLNPARNRPNLTIKGNSPVQRVVFDGTRATGVEAVVDGTTTVYRAEEIVLAAGAIKTPHLLLVSGVGPEKELRNLGIPVVRDLPGVGKNFSDHPNIALSWRSKVPLADYASTHSMGAVLNFTATGSPFVGDLEILPLLKPIGHMLTGSSPAESGTALIADVNRFRTVMKGVAPQKFAHEVLRQDDLVLLVSLQAETSRGNITLESPDPAVPPRIDFNYLTTQTDRVRLREGVRTAARLLQTRAFDGIFDHLTDLSEQALHDDAQLDTWIQAHLGTAIHLCGSAKFGPSTDSDAVADQYGRVRGTEGLWIADTSLLPTAPSRGPAATAVLIGERVAEFIQQLPNVCSGTGPAPTDAMHGGSERIADLTVNDAPNDALVD